MRGMGNMQGMMKKMQKNAKGNDAGSRRAKCKDI